MGTWGGAGGRSERERGAGVPLRGLGGRSVDWLLTLSEMGNRERSLNEDRFG